MDVGGTFLRSVTVKTGCFSGVETTLRKSALGTRLLRFSKDEPREGVVAYEEINRYFAASPQPWRDCALLMLSIGCRPGELYGLRWEQVALNDDGGYIRIPEGKSLAARRTLPPVSVAYRLLWERYAEAFQVCRQGRIG